MVVIVSHRYDKKLKSQKQDGLGGWSKFISNLSIPSINHFIVYTDKESYFNFFSLVFESNFYIVVNHKQKMKNYD